MRYMRGISETAKQRTAAAYLSNLSGSGVRSLGSSLVERYRFRRERAQIDPYPLTLSPLNGSEKLQHARGWSKEVNIPKAKDLAVANLFKSTTARLCILTCDSANTHYR